MNIIDDSAIIKQANSDGTDDDVKLLNKMMEWLHSAETTTSESDWRELAKESYDFYSGKQDTQEVLDLLEEQNRTATVYNETKPKVDMLIGLASQNRKAPMVFPVETNDAALAEIANGAFKHFRRTARVARNEIECFEHMAKAGRALLHFYTAGDDPYAPEIKSKRIHGRDFWLDPLSVEYDMSDARFLFVDKYFSKDDLEYFFPDLKADDIKTFSQDNPESPSFYSQERDMYRVTECWYRKIEKVHWVKNPLTRRSEPLTVKEYADFKKKIKEGITLPNGQQLQADQFPSIEKVRKTIHYAIFSNTKVIKNEASPYKHGEFPYILFGAYKDDDTNCWFGAIEAMKDPQRGINVMRRQLQHLLQTAPKGIFMHEVGAVIDIEGYENRSSEPNFHMELAQGALTKGQVKFSEQPQISPVYAQLISLDTQTMKDASGIQDSLMGQQTSSREPGVTVRMRQETGLAVLFIIFDNYRESRMQAGRQLLSLMQQYITDEQLIRIEGEEGAKLTQINSQKDPNAPGFNDISVGKYDLVIDEAVENQTMRMATAQMLTDYSQNNPGTIPPDLIMEYSDLPLTAITKVKEYSKMMMEREERIKMASVQADQQSQQAKLELEKMALDIKIQIASMDGNIKLLVASLQNETQKEISEDQLIVQHGEHLNTLEHQREMLDSQLGVGHKEHLDTLEHQKEMQSKKGGSENV
jgi:hypothetical protein